MNLCLNVIAPKIFLMFEARFGHSYIQNYDAILRSSIVLSHTDLLWRAVLLTMIALPNGLRLGSIKFIRGCLRRLIDDGQQYRVQRVYRGVAQLYVERYRRILRIGRTGTAGQSRRPYWCISYDQQYSAFPGGFGE